MLFNHYRLLSGFFILIFLSLGMQAQNIPFKKQHFKNKTSKFKEAVKQLNIADEILETELDYDKALPFYLRANKFNANNIPLNLKIANCYLLGDKTDKTAAKPYLQKIIEIDSTFLEAYYLLGTAHQYASEWHEAITNYERYLSFTIKNKAISDKAEIRIKQCQNGLELCKEKKRLLTTNLGRRINSLYPEYGAVFTPDMKRLYFTSRKYKTTGFDIDTDFNYYEDIYEARLVNGSWSRVKNIGEEINTNGHEAVLSISHDGKKMLIYKGNRNGDIYISEKLKKAWSEPKPLPAPINSKYRETAACFSPNGKTIYFVSDRPGTLGRLDIFKSDYKRRSGWSEPENLGTNINTPQNEDAVFISHTGKELYFSSDGERSIGGFDVFKSSLMEDSWQKAENLGVPLNSPYDDLYYTTDSTNTMAFYSSEKAGTKGGLDIYKVIYLSPEKPVNLIGTSFQDTLPSPDIDTWLLEIIDENEVQKQIVFNGNVTSKDGNALQAEIQIEDIIQQAVVHKDTLSLKNRFTYNLTSNTRYKITVQTKGYLPISQEVVLSENSTKNFILTPLAKGSKLTLNDIYFETGAATLSKDSQASLMNLYQFLKQNPNITALLVGHTDNVGDPQQNLTLSKQRAQAVFLWLLQKGIAKKRLRFIGKGDTQPVGDNNTIEGRQQNRRTEIEILKAD